MSEKTALYCRVSTTDQNLARQRDFEGTLHLYQVFEEQLDEDRLQTYVTELEVTDAYDELRRA